MKKKVSNAFGKKQYLLGVDEEGTYYWLEEASWDCEWYWGFGYIETFTNNKNPQLSKDIRSHSHFDMFFNNKNQNGYTAFKEFFKDMTVSEKQLWKLLELMKTFYILRDYSDCLYIGGANYTANPIAEEIKSKAEYDRINNVLIPKLINEVYSILS